MTSLFHDIIFGPVHSRRLGLSLGVNLLPTESKLCSFDCIYCECGWNAEHPGARRFNTREDVRTQLAATLRRMVADGTPPDVITFAGNGEPTMHPEFEAVIETFLLGGTFMILTAFHGFCMALADSVPGVSGGTIAFILGFYDRFINALHGLFRGNWKQRKAALTYLLKLGIGWGIGMVSCVVLLSSLFEQNIYFMSSLFLGLTVCSIPFVAMAEQEALENWRNSGFLLVGVAAVVGLTLLRTHAVGLGVINYTQLQPLQFGWIFLSGAVAITAMVLPGISGSSVLLIAGVYLPTIQAVHSLLGLQLVVIPGLCALGLGVLTGIGLSIRAIRTALQNHRSAMVWLVLGLMLGSLYAIANGPASLDTPLPPLSFTNFQIPAFLLGIVLLFALEGLKKTMEKKDGGNK